MRNYLLAIALLATTISYSQNFRGFSGVAYSNGEWSLSWLEYRMDTGKHIGRLILDKREVEQLHNDVIKVLKSKKAISLSRPKYRIENFTNAIAIYNTNNDSIIVTKGMELEILLQDLSISVTVM